MTVTKRTVKFPCYRLPFQGALARGKVCRDGGEGHGDMVYPSDVGELSSDPVRRASELKVR
jgi:hypothetical protein